MKSISEVAGGMEFVAVPASGQLRVVEPDYDIAGDIRRSVAWAAPKYKTSGVCQALESFNEWAHDFIRHDASPSEQLGLKKAGFTACCNAEMCVCAGRGKELSGRIAAFLQPLKIWTRP
eukprot:5754215-Pyramimonas_sp.AAC.1